MKNLIHRTLLAGAALALAPFAASAADQVPEGHKMGYLVIGFHWATYETPGAKTECPHGFNPWGPREQFKALFPDDGTKRTAQETHLAREIAAWFPDTTPDKFDYWEATGTTALGMNLDGKVGPNDFTGPDGEKGIDNQLYRAIGCVQNLRPPDGATSFFANQAIGEERWNRVLLEITNLDSMTNDDSVEVTLYQGKDHILTDATGNTIMPGGSQRIDSRWGGRMVQHFHGKVVDGVLITEPVSMATIPWSSFQLPTVQKFHDMRMRLKLLPDRAEGMIAGYVDVENWYLQTVKSESTHHQSYGQSSPPSMYKALRRLADAYPDPVTGANTAISGALEAKFVQAFIIHPEGEKTVAAAPSPRRVASTPDETKAVNK